MISSREIATRFGLDPSGQILEIPDLDRHGFAALLGEWGMRVGAEVGVERGLYSKALFLRIPGLRLYCIDPWQAYQGYLEHISQEKLDWLYEEARARLEPFDPVLIRGFSVEAARQFEDGSLDFAYIDANHELSHVINDLTAWAPKVRKGGVVAGHDYIRRRDPRLRMHVVEAVHAYIHAWRIRPLFLVGRKHPKGDETRDAVRTWFWVAE